MYAFDVVQRITYKSSSCSENTSTNFVHMTRPAPVGVPWEFPCSLSLSLSLSLSSLSLSLSFSLSFSVSLSLSLSLSLPLSLFLVEWEKAMTKRMACSFYFFFFSVNTIDFRMQGNLLLLVEVWYYTLFQYVRLYTMHRQTCWLSFFADIIVNFLSSLYSGWSATLLPSFLPLAKANPSRTGREFRTCQNKLALLFE